VSVTKAVQGRFAPVRAAGPSRRERLLALQGWRGDGLSQACSAAPADRLAPAFCMVSGIAVGLTQSIPLALAVAATAVVGAATGRHPIESLHQLVVRATCRGRVAPPGTAARRFTCALAATWLVAISVAFALDATGLGVGLSFALAAVAAVYTTLGFCIPATVFTALFGAERATRPTLPAGFRPTAAETSPAGAAPANRPRG
jgi:hypothetical protein